MGVAVLEHILRNVLHSQSQLQVTGHSLGTAYLIRKRCRSFSHNVLGNACNG
jgi:hypothetical protein